MCFETTSLPAEHSFRDAVAEQLPHGPVELVQFGGQQRQLLRRAHARVVVLGRRLGLGDVLNDGPRQAVDAALRVLVPDGGELVERRADLDDVVFLL